MNLNPSIPHLSANQNSEPQQAKFSKWISIDLLIDEKEMQNLLDFCQPLFLITMQQVTEDSSFILEIKEFIKVYSKYILLLKNGEIPNFKDFKKYFYLFFSSHINEINIRELSSSKKVLVFNTPLIEVKPISLTVSKVDHSIRSMPVHANGILWGLRLSFPQIIQKAGSHDIESIDFQKQPNGILFKKIREWIRKNTRATPFIIDDKKINLPIRLGKNCFSWINDHPQLKHFQINIEP